MGVDLLLAYLNTSTVKVVKYSLGLIVLSMSGVLHAGEERPSTPEISSFDESYLLRFPEKASPPWGIFMGFRTASIPFRTKDDVVSDIFPNFYYEGERFFLRGIEGGMKLWKGDRKGLDLIGRYRFFDIPKEFQNEVRGDSFDMGLQAYWMLGEDARLEAEILNDLRGNLYAAGRLKKDFKGRKWLLTPELELRFKTSGFNTRYYGLETYDIDAGVELSAGVSGRYHVWRNLHLQGGVKVGLLDSAARKSPVIEDEVNWEAYLGIGFHDFVENGEARKLDAKPYWRIAQGWGTSSNLGEIIGGEIERENVDVDMTSLFYGHPLSDTLFGLPIEVYLTPGIVYHYHSSVQRSAVEVVLGMKIYYTLPLPWRVRIGAAEGISYTDSVTYYERQNMANKNLDPSRLLNYLDITVDLNLGDVFNSETIGDLWLGCGIHHRSGIFGSASAFGRISGGSNFPSVYLQWSKGF